MGAVDLLGSIIFAPFLFIRGKFSTKKGPHNILVVRLDQIGDMVQAIPFFEALKRKYPLSTVHAVCVKDCAFLLKNNRNVDALHTVPSSWFYPERKANMADYAGLIKVLRRAGIDEAYDLRGDIRNLIFLRLCGAKKVMGYDCAGGGFLIDKKFPYDRDEHEIDKNLKLIGAKAEKEVAVEFPRSVSEEKTVRAFIDENGGPKTRRIIIHPFTRGGSRMWGMGKYADLAVKISKKENVRIFIIGGKDDERDSDIFSWNDKVINCIGRFSLGLTVEMLRQSHAFIGNNSGPQYFAAYSGIKSCVIYGNSVNYKSWQPKVKEDNFIALSKPTDCGPCELSVCNQKTHRCMDLITVDEVYNAVEGWL